MFLAADLGAESGRVMAATLDDSGFQLLERNRFSTAPVHRDGALVWDVVRFHDAIVDGIAATPGATSIGIDGWGVDFALIGADGELAAPPRCYRDPLTAGILPALFTRVARERLFARTGIQMMEINTVCQLLALEMASAPELAATRRLLLLPDLLLHWLGATAEVERTNASTTQMLSADGSWASDIVSDIGIDPSILPPVVEPGTARGTLHGPRVARIAGIHADLVSVASHDTASAVVAAPLARSGDTAFISSGTWSLVGLEVAEPVLSPLALAFNLSNERGYAGTVRLLRNVMGLWLLQECRRSFAAADGAPVTYEEMVTLAEAAPAFTAVVDPDHRAFLRPVDLPAAAIEVCAASEQTAPCDRGTLVRVLLESLALRYRWTIAALARTAAQSIGSISIIGGGSRNRLLCQLTADATGLPVTAGPVEATALGNAIVQAISQGALPNVAQARRLIAARSDLEHYEPRPDARWDDAYARFCALPGVGQPCEVRP